MAKKKIIETFEKQDVPETLENHQFFGLNLDIEQQQFRDAIWDNKHKIIFCNAKAGCGKTTIALGTAELLVKYGRYDGIIYVVAPYGENKQGFLPGSITEKSEIFFEPIYQAMLTCGINPYTAVINESLTSAKYEQGYIKCLTHTYLRGVNFHNKIVILDETQNYDFGSLKKTLTRISDDCLVIVIGHDKQKDTSDNTNAFLRYLNFFKYLNDERVAVCQLTINHRGWLSTMADALE